MSNFTQGNWHQGSYFWLCTIEHKHGQGDCDYKDAYVDNKHHVSVTKDDGNHSILISSDESGDVLSEADAKLISAAPDLLEALRDMVHAARKQDWQNNYPGELVRARAAIEKATGETP